MRTADRSAYLAYLMPGLLLGTEIGHHGWLAPAWCLALTVLGHFWSKSAFDRDPK